LSFISTSKARGDHNFLKIISKIKGKCSLNAEFLKRELRCIPLIKIGKNGLRTMLKGRAFEQRIAT